MTTEEIIIQRPEAPSAAQVLRGDLAAGTGLHEATALRLQGRQATIRMVEPANAMLAMMCTGIILTPAHAEGKMTWEQYVQRLSQQPPVAPS